MLFKARSSSNFAPPRTWLLRALHCAQCMLQSICTQCAQHTTCAQHSTASQRCVHLSLSSHSAHFQPTIPICLKKNTFPIPQKSQLSICKASVKLIPLLPYPFQPPHTTTAACFGQQLTNMRRTEDFGVTHIFATFRWRSQCDFGTLLLMPLPAMHAFLHLPATEPTLGSRLGWAARWADVQQPVEPQANPPLITNHRLQY